MLPLRVSCCVDVTPLPKILARIITTKIRKALDGCYTRMLRAALNVNWKTHMAFAGHRKRAEGYIVLKLVTWRPTQGARSKGRPKKTYVDLLEDDTGYAVNEVNSMQDRRLWRAIINAR